YIVLPTFGYNNENYRITESVNSTWYQAVDYCNNLNYGGYSDWVLPTKEMLGTIFVIDKSVFFNESFYWSETEYDEENAWGINTKSGTFNYARKTLNKTEVTTLTGMRRTYHYVRCIRKEDKRR
ncbi:MAG: DUF1566 domain-containing protein, partial [Bacteroidales bacterium]|nr:DUF1566 domain-containing protein [Bacteroidales bacterium]